jgi:putative addiction module component (TIGR02574 family)
MSTEALLNEVRKLSVSERIQFVEDVWDSIGAEQPDFPLTPEQRDELDRRLEDLRADPRPGEPWEQVKARILKQP